MRIRTARIGLDWWLWIPALAEPVIGPRFARTRWLGRNDRGGLLRRLALAAFLLLGNARLLAAQAAQVVELGAANLAPAHDLDRVDHRRVEREDALHALAVGNLAHREALVNATARAR